MKDPCLRVHFNDCNLPVYGQHLFTSVYPIELSIAQWFIRAVFTLSSNRIDHVVVYCYAERWSAEQWGNGVCPENEKFLLFHCSRFFFIKADE